MRKIAAAGLLALPLLLSTCRPAVAQFWPCPFAGCGGPCLNWFGKIHQHGPLFNYGPYAGYYPFEPYGPWTSDLRYNPPPVVRDRHTFPHVHNVIEKTVAVVTLQNVWKRLSPLQSHLAGRDGLFHGGHGDGGGLFHGGKGKGKAGCASGDCASASDHGPACTLCGQTAQVPAAGTATVLLTGGSN